LNGRRAGFSVFPFTRAQYGATFGTVGAQTRDIDEISSDCVLSGFAHAERQIVRIRCSPLLSSATVTPMQKKQASYLQESSIAQVEEVTVKIS